MVDLIALYDKIKIALRAEDDAVTRQYFDPSFKLYEDPGMPYGGEFAGAAHFIKTRRKVKEHWSLAIESVCASPEQDRLVVVLRLTGLPDKATAGLETLVCVVWRFRGEMATEARVLYYDTPTMGGAVARSEQSRANIQADAAPASG